MELKYYDKPWLPAIKGAFLIIFGIMAMLHIVGTIKSLAVLFAFLIAMIGIMLIATGIMSKKSSFRGWTIVSGALNLAFCIYLAMHVDTANNLTEARVKVLTLIFVWVLYFAVTELIEAGLLLYKQNAYSAIFVITGLLSLTFAYFMNVVAGNFTPQTVSHIGVIALVIGIVNELCAYLLSRVKE